VDFFASQELARRNTRKLVVLMIVTLLSITAAVYGVVLIAFGLLSDSGGLANSPHAISLYLQAFLWTLFGVTTIVGVGSLVKVMELQKGGPAIAHMLRGRRLQPNTTVLAERRVLNVVEEMALAAGVPVPPVFVLDHESGINAFAAGYTVDDAVIGLNRGTIETLNRDELQGVIGHEFSHILNGDMRMSLRMIGILHGIQVIALIGAMLLRILGNSGGYRSRSSKDKGEGGVLIALLILGAGMMVVGSIGLFFARLIKASISRQREYLADASSVQFTRNPLAISGALKMIAVNTDHSRIAAANAEEISHMFFARMNGSLMSGLLSTHPPLDKRIRAIEPNFDGDYPGYVRSRATATIAGRADESQQKKEAPESPVDRFGRFPMGLGRGFPGMNVPLWGAALESFEPTEVIAGIGVPTDDDVIYSQLLIGNIPRALLDAARDVYLARCLVFASLLDENVEVRKVQLEMLHEHTEAGVLEHVRDLWPMISNVDLRFRMPIFEILQGTLVGLSPEQYRTFRKIIATLIEADRKISLFEFFLRHHLVVHLDRHFGKGLPNAIRFKRVEDVAGSIQIALKMMADVGLDDDVQRRAAFEFGVRQWRGGPAIEYLAGNISFAKLAGAIDELSQATPAIKKEVLMAAARVVSFDRKISVGEAELFRAFSESLDCPVPPLLANPDPA
jgi:Zn-dependent protease with chaperone function